MSAIRSCVLLLFAVCCLPAIAQDTISQRDRVLTATKIYQQVTAFFPELSPAQFDRDYAEYITQILNSSDDRRTFDLASMALIATLHDAHTWFFDRWFEKEYGQPVGFAAWPLHNQWTVIRSEIPSLHPGDVIEAIDGTPTQQYFERNRRYISSSSERDTQVSFFDTPVLFPERFTLTLDGNRKVVIDRRHDKKEDPSMTTEGRWLANGSVAYIKVPVFRGIETQAQALGFLRKFHDAKAVILDVRGNPGLGDGSPLQRSLMDKPYATWIEHSSMQGGVVLRHMGIHPQSVHITTADANIDSSNALYTGRLILLVDRGCTCACEDFVMPFKFSHRAILVGETTFGSFSATNFTQFENGMMLNIAAVRHTFPDGSRFEGIGIAPDVEVLPSAGDLKSGNDIVLEKALATAK